MLTPFLAVSSAWVLIGVVVLFALLGYLVFQNVVSARRAAKWRPAEEKMAKLGMKEDEVEELRRLGRYTSSEPLRLLTHIGVFESAVHAYFDKLAHPEDIHEDESAQEADRKVSSLRLKLGFSEPAGVRIYSTRQLVPGTPVELAFARRGRAVPGEAKVGRHREDVLELVDLAPVRESFVGRPAEGFVLVSQRRYRFPMDVLKVNTEERSCLVTHSLEVRRADRRAFGRVDINVPLEYRAEADSMAKHREGALCNLSARGAGITCADRFKKGDKLVLYLKPSDCVKDTTGLAEEVLEERTVTGTVVAGVSARAPVYHVEFQDISQAEQNNLSQLVRAVEREAPRSGLDQE